MDSNYLLLRLGAETALIDAAVVCSVLELDAVTPVPCAPHHVVGLAALRSRPITVIDCYRALDLAPTNPREDAPASGMLAVVVELDHHLYALLVDEVMDVLALDAVPTPSRMQLQRGWARVQRGLVETAQGPALLIDPAALVAGMPEAAAA